MKRSSYINIYTLFLVFSLAALGQPLKAQEVNTPTPQMTQAQVIQIAKDFCRRIGKSVTDHAITKFPNELDEDEHWQPEWDIQFGGQAEVGVIDATGVVADYDDLHYDHVADVTPPDPSLYLPPEAAEKRALAFIKQTGESEDIGDADTSMFAAVRNPTAREVSMLVEWNRMFHGIPYLHEAARVILNAETGEIITGGLVFPSPPLTADQAVLAQNPTRMARADQAVALTQAHMVYDLGFRGSATLRDTTLKVVTVPVGPDTPDAPQPKVGRIAWVVRYTGDVWEEDTWIDAETGRVVGGESASGGFGGGRGHPAAGLSLPLKTVLPDVQAVYARRADSSATSGWAAVKDAAFTAKDQPQQIAALKAAMPAAAPAVLPVDQLILAGKDNSMAVYGYDPATGRLGAGTDWVTVPSGFRAWMQKRLTGTAGAPG